MGIVGPSASPRAEAAWLPEDAAAGSVPSPPGSRAGCEPDSRAAVETLRDAARVAGLEHRACAALAVLVWIAGRETGWRWAGVGGWMLHREMDAFARASGLQTPCTLDALTRRGWITCREVRDRGGGRIHLYRARGPGARVLDVALGRTLGRGTPLREEVARDDPRMLFMPLGAWAALAALREEAVRRDGQRRWETCGWLTSAELSDSLGPAACFDTTDLYWLERRDLIERRYGLIPARRRSPPVYWRVKALARRARVLDDFGIASGLSALLQVGLAASARATDGEERRSVGDLVAAYRARLATPPPLATEFVRELHRGAAA